MNKHTQGEWRTGLLQGFLWTDVLDDNGNTVAKVHTHKMVRPYASEPDPEGMANLALVKASPKFLETLRWIAWEIESGCGDKADILRAVQEAIKEAQL